MTAATQREALLALLADGMWHHRDDCQRIGGDRFQARLHESRLAYEYSRDFSQWRLTGGVREAKLQRQTRAQLEAEVVSLRAEVERLRARVSRQGELWETAP